MKYLLLLIPITFLILFIWSSINMCNQSTKDWKTLEDLEKRSKEVNTKEEIEEFQKEFCEKANKIHNEFIKPKLHTIDGYLRGLYKQYTK